MHCPNCKKVIPEDSVFCPECGEKIPEQSRNQSIGSFCPECGTRNMPGARFCEECGTSLSQPEFQKTENRQSEPVERRQGQNGGKGLLIAGILVLLIAVGMGGAIAVYHLTGQSKTESVEVNNVASDVEDAEVTEESEKSENETTKNSKSGADMEEEADAKTDSAITAESDSGEEKSGKYDSKEGGIHRYEYVISDCTWEQAYSECLKKGGYLVRINSREEYDYILDEIAAKNLNQVHFSIGAKRNSNGKDYYWVNEENQLYGDKVNSPAYWCSTEWMTGEPSFEDDGIMEMYLDIFFYKDMNRWVWNDIPNDIVAVVPSYSGKLGYICEYEDE